MLSLSVKSQPHKQHIWFFPTYRQKLKNQLLPDCIMEETTNRFPTDSSVLSEKHLQGHRTKKGSSAIANEPF